MIAHNYNLVVQQEIRDHKFRARSLALKMDGAVTPRAKYQDIDFVVPPNVPTVGGVAKAKVKKDEKADNANRSMAP